MDQIFIRNLIARGVIGVGEQERANPQDIVINIILFTDATQCGMSDKITDTVNYRTVAKKVLKHAESAARYTVEALAEDIAKICLEQKLVEGARVKVEKPGAVRFTESVGVEIERYKEK
jgi:FolB domain-containing protein